MSKGYLLIIISGIFSIVLIITGCSSELPENVALKKSLTQHIKPIEKVPLKDSLIINMRGLTNFSWDSLYVFNGRCSSEKISAAIGTTWRDGGTQAWFDSYPDVLFIFMNKGKVAAHVWYEYFPDNEQPDYIHFRGVWNNGELYTPTTAVFIVRHEYEVSPYTIYMRAVGLHEKPIYRPGFSPTSFTYY